MKSITPELIEKYAVNGPRYTSYPTAVEFNSSVNSMLWRKHLEKSTSKHTALSLYVHVPFCQSLCYFCACHKIITTDRRVAAPFLQGIHREVAAYREVFSDTCAVTQLHWGGGSPNFLCDEDTIELFDILHGAFPNIHSDAEISYEADPRSMTHKRLGMLRSLGFNRISFGVQDFDPRVQEIINRVQPFEMVRDHCHAARDHGFQSINFDLIYGLPGQSVSSLAQTIEHVLSIRPKRVALYGYAHVPWLKKTQRKFERVGLPRPKERTDLLCLATTMFCQAGYHYIGMDHFALPDDELVQAQEQGTLTRNFMGYTVHRAERLLGLGPSSISSLPSCYAQNVKDLDRYQSLVEEHGLAIERGIERTIEDCIRGAIITDILCQARINCSEIEQRWQIEFNSTFRDAIVSLKDYERDGLVNVDSTGYQLTELGRFFMRNVAMLFDAYLVKHLPQKATVFSQAV